VKELVPSPALRCTRLGSRGQHAGGRGSRAPQFVLAAGILVLGGAGPLQVVLASARSRTSRRLRPQMRRRKLSCRFFRRGRRAACRCSTRIPAGAHRFFPRLDLLLSALRNQSRILWHFVNRLLALVVSQLMQSAAEYRCVRNHRSRCLPWTAALEARIAPATRPSSEGAA
jgi:hypothetical protein